MGQDAAAQESRGSRRRMVSETARHLARLADIESSSISSTEDIIHPHKARGVGNPRNVKI